MRETFCFAMQSVRPKLHSQGLRIHARIMVRIAMVVDVVVVLLQKSSLRALIAYYHGVLHAGARDRMVMTAPMRLKCKFSRFLFVSISIYKECSKHAFLELWRRNQVLEAVPANLPCTIPLCFVSGWLRTFKMVMPSSQVMQCSDAVKSNNVVEQCSEIV